MRKWWICISFILALLFTAGCAAENGSSSSRSDQATAETSEELMQEYPEDSEGWAADTSAGTTADTETDYGGHKVIMTASLGLETRAFDEDLAVIKQKAAELGGYVANSDISGKKPENYGDSGRYATLTLRVPKENFESFLSSARGVATVTYENTGSEDITASYFDTQSRLEIYKTQRERTLDLLKEADNMEDIITLETELSRLTYEIESLTTQLRQWDDLVDFATVTISLDEVPLATAVSGDESIWTRMQDGLTNTLGGMAVFFEGLLVFLVAASPVLLLLAIIAVVIVLLARRSARRRKERQKNMPVYTYPAPPYPVPPQAPGAAQAPPAAGSEADKEGDMTEPSEKNKT